MTIIQYLLCLAVFAGLGFVWYKLFKAEPMREWLRFSLAMSAVAAAILTMKYLILT